MLVRNAISLQPWAFGHDEGSVKINLLLLLEMVKLI